MIGGKWVKEKETRTFMDFFMNNEECYTFYEGSEMLNNLKQSWSFLKTLYVALLEVTFPLVTLLRRVLNTKMIEITRYFPWDKQECFWGCILMSK